jgi:hypothetical protein
MIAVSAQYFNATGTRKYVACANLRRQADEVRQWWTCAAG